MIYDLSFQLSFLIYDVVGDSPIKYCHGSLIFTVRLTEFYNVINYLFS